jgi:CRP/FNR family transcriptional regulator, cyclic AMP receptor protein
VTDYSPPAEQYRLLAKVDILEQLPPEEVERVALLSSCTHLEAGEAFALDEGRRALFLLTSGRVRVHESNAGGHDLTISMGGEGTVVGQTSFAPQRSWALRVEALEPSVLRILGWEGFEEIARRNPDVSIRMIRLLSERLGACEGRLSDLVRKEVPARLASLVLGLSEHQGVVMGDGSRKIPVRYTHQQLASMVGSNREAITRALGRLKREGSVEIRDRHIHVVDVDALARSAGLER